MSRWCHWTAEKGHQREEKFFSPKLRSLSIRASRIFTSVASVFHATCLCSSELGGWKRQLKWTCIQLNLQLRLKHTSWVKVVVNCPWFCFTGSHFKGFSKKTKRETAITKVKTWEKSFKVNFKTMLITYLVPSTIRVKYYKWLFWLKFWPEFRDNFSSFHTFFPCKKNPR